MGQLPISVVYRNVFTRRVLFEVVGAAVFLLGHGFALDLFLLFAGCPPLRSLCPVASTSSRCGCFFGSRIVLLHVAVLCTVRRVPGLDLL